MLAGRTILIVDAEYLLALDIERRLEGLGAGRSIIAISAAGAMDRAEDWAECALAIIEIEESLPQSIALARTLRHGGIPVIGVTADSRLTGGMSRLEGIPILLKPMVEDTLAEAARAVLARPAQNE